MGLLTHALVDLSDRGLAASTEGTVVGRGLKLSISLLGALAVAFLAGFVVFMHRVATYEWATPVVSGDAVVVLTGGDSRIKDGLNLFNSGVGRRLLISGVHHAVTRQELQRLSHAPQPLLFDCCVDIGYVAQSTTGNAAEAREWLEIWGFRRVVLVTSTYHMPRSLIEFRRALPGVELVPYPIVRRDRSGDDWWHSRGALKRVFFEYVKCWPAAARLVLSRLHQDRGPISLPDTPASEVSSSPRNVTGL